MTGRWLTLLEAHIEKGILGLAALVLFAMLYMFLIESPNKVSYGQEELGPRALLEKIKSDADALQNSVRNASIEEGEIENFSDRLKRHHAAGIFAKGSQEEPGLASKLRLAANYGVKTAVPGLEESEDAAKSIVLVTPLPPSPPKLRTGRSLAVRQQAQIAGFEEFAAAAPPEETTDADEVAWVTIAAYFEKKAQYNEMIKAGYAPYRSKAYVVGVDVERQEVLSSGEFSQWQQVTPGKAMPKVELEQPQFDDQTGELLNKDDIRQAFAIVKAAQQPLMQSPFYAVEGGDLWDVPPLEGYEDEEEAENEEEEALAAAPGRGRRTPAPPSTRVRTGGRSRTGGGGRSGGGGRPTRTTGGGGAGSTGGSARSDAERRAEARKEIRADLAEAKKLLGQRDYSGAREMALGITRHADATKGDIRKASEVVKAADRYLKRESDRGDREVTETIRHPESGEPVVWFHDDSVEAGKTYRYRMRVNLWNRYVGRMRSMRDPEEAKQTITAGDWSYPSEPATVTPNTYFFFSGTREDDTASVDVWKWRKGFWKKQRFDVSIGDVIGDVRNIKTGEYNEEGHEVRSDVDFATGAIVLDLRFDEQIQARWPGKDGTFSYRDKTSTVMVYLDPADGQVKERVLLFDRRDPKKKALEEEAL